MYRSMVFDPARRPLDSLEAWLDCALREESVDIVHECPLTTTE